MVVSANDSQVLPAPRERRGMPYSSISLRICGERTPYRAPICAVESSCRWQRVSNVGLLSRSFKVGRAAPQRRLRVRLMTKRPSAKAAKTASCFMVFVFVFLWRVRSEESSGTVHGNTPPNHVIECVLLGQSPVQRFAMLLVQSCLPLFACFGPTRLSFLNVHNRIKRFGSTKEPKQQADLFCVVLGRLRRLIS